MRHPRSYRLHHQMHLSRTFAMTLARGQREGYQPLPEAAVNVSSSLTT